MIPALPECSRALRRLLTPRIHAAARTPGADRYRKHFPVTAHCWLLVLHVLLSSPSLRQTHALLCGLPGTFARLGLDRASGTRCWKMMPPMDQPARLATFAAVS